MGAYGAKDVSPERRAIIKWHLKQGMTQREIAKKVSVSEKTVWLIKHRMDRGEDIFSTKRGICDRKRATIQRYLKQGRMTSTEIAKKVSVSQTTVITIKQKMNRGEDIVCSKRPGKCGRKSKMAPRVQSKISRCVDGRITNRKNNFKRKHPKSTSNTSNKKYAAEQAAKELRVNPRVPVSQQSERFNTCQQERTAVRQKNPVVTTSSQTQHIANCPPSMTNFADTPTTSTNRTDVTQDKSIYFSTKSDGHRLRSSRGRPRNSLDQSSVNDNAEGPNAENDNASEINDTFTSPSTIYFHDGIPNSGSSRHEESSKTLVENTDASASSKDSLVVMAGSSRFDSSSNKMSPILHRRSIRHERIPERLRGNTDIVDEPMPRDVRAPSARHDDEVLITATAPSVSPATIQKQKCAQLLREAMNHLKSFVKGTDHLKRFVKATDHLKGFVEKLETVIEMVDEDQVV